MRRWAPRSPAGLSAAPSPLPVPGGMIHSPVVGGPVFPAGKTLARSEVLLPVRQAILVFFLLGEKLKPGPGVAE